MQFTSNLFAIILFTCTIFIVRNASGNDFDFQAVYLDARCFATCSTEFSLIKPLEQIINVSTIWPIFHGEYNENILLCYYSCIQCDQKETSQESVGCATSTFAPCVSGRLYCREDTFILCYDSKPSIPVDKPTVRFSYTDFHSFEVSWPGISDLDIYASTEECQSYTTFILRVNSVDAVIYYMVFEYATKIQLFNNLVNTFSNSFNISFGAVNKAGFSGFGPDNVFQLRDRDPGPVGNLRYSFTENTIYPEEYILLLIWDLPNKNYENLYSIVINVLYVGDAPTSFCSQFYVLKNNKTILLTRDTTQYSFQHDGDNLGPISNCQYEFKITSQFSIYGISMAKTLVFHPYICEKALPFEIDFSFLPFNRENNFLRIQGYWHPILNGTLLYIYQLNILLDSNSGVLINIVKETNFTNIVISSREVAVEDALIPPIYISYEIDAYLSVNLNCSVVSYNGYFVLKALFPTIPLNFNANFEESTNILHIHWDEPENFGGPLEGFQLLLNYTKFGYILQNRTFNIDYNETQKLIDLANTTRVSIKMRAKNIFGYGNFTKFIHFYLSDQIDARLPIVTLNIPTESSLDPNSFSKVTVLIITPFATLFIGVWLIGFFSCVFILARRNRGRLRLSQSDSRNSLDKCEIPYAQLHFLPQTLGTGAFGLVRKAILKKSSKYSIVVAVKMTRDDATDVEVNDLVQEIRRMKKIGKHPHIVEFFGCVSSDRPICLILEFIPYGDLLTLLRKLRNERDMNIGPNYIHWFGLLTLSDFSDFAYQIAEGMGYISSLKLVHRDLACRNILVAENKQLKISDFGLAREFDKYYDCNEDKEYYRLHIHNDRLPIRWMAVESITEFIFSTKSDVWSYGIALWEIATLGRTPYSAIPNSRFLQYIFSKNRLEIPASCTPEMFEVMMSCWHENPDHRPNFDELKEIILNIHIKYEDKRILSIQLSDSDELTSADLSGSFNWELPIQANQHSYSANIIQKQNFEGTPSLSSLEIMKSNLGVRNNTQITLKQPCTLETPSTISVATPFLYKTIDTYNMQEETVIVNPNEGVDNVKKNVSNEFLISDRPESHEEILPCSYPLQSISRTSNDPLYQTSPNFLLNCSKLYSGISIPTENSTKYIFTPKPLFVNNSEDPETEL